jgi:hypothetical protein
MVVDRLRVLVAAAVIAVLVAAPATGHGQTLSASGAVLAGLTVNVASAQITYNVDLAGDVPTATYVMAHMPDGKSLQRSNLGYWLPWNGQLETLIDNKFVAAGSSLTFKVIDQDIRDRMFPIRFVIAYRTASAFKFGVFEVSPQ